MKYIIVLVSLSALSLMGCADNSDATQPNLRIACDVEMEIPDTTISIDLLRYNRESSVWKLQGALYSGHVIDRYDNGQLKDKFGILNGKKQHRLTKWYPDGHLREISHYSQGKLHGSKKLWDHEVQHQLLSELNYTNGKLHGAQTKWYQSGELYQKLNYNMGKEDGLQQAFRKNGELYANYEAQDGRIFGLKKSALCFGIAAEQIQFDY